MKVAVMANGEWDALWGREELREKELDLLICADGGANHAISSGKIPDVLIGDLDSITVENLNLCQDKGIKIIKYSVEKDQTDLELAIDYAHSYLKACGQPQDEIILYAAGGKRLDHLLGNIALMMGYAQKQRKVRMVDQHHHAWIISSSTEMIWGTKGQELSILPVVEQATVSSQGLYYELENLTLFLNEARGISNVLEKEKALITVHEGMVMIIILMGNNKH